MNRRSLCLAASLVMTAASTPAVAGPFKAYVTTYHGPIVNDYADPTLRGANCAHTLYFWGAIEKAATPGYPYSVQYRWLTQAGPGPTKEQNFGIVASTVQAGQMTVNVSAPLNSSRNVWVQFEILKPQHVLSNKISITWYCKPMAPSQPIKPGTWPTK